MTVLLLERVPPGLRGLLSRWMIQPRQGVFVGTLSARIRELLWTDVLSKLKTGGATLIWSDPTHPQGYRVLMGGSSRIPLQDFEGLNLPWANEAR